MEGYLLHDLLWKCVDNFVRVELQLYETGLIIDGMTEGCQADWL